MSQIDDLLARQAEALARLQEQEARRLVGLLRDARRELAERLAALDDHTPYSAQRARILLAQVQAAMEALRRRMDESLTRQAELAGKAALRDMLAVIRANEPEFTDAGNAIEFRALSRFSMERGLRLHTYSTGRYTSDMMAQVARELSMGTLTGASIPELTKRIAGVIDKGTARASLIARQETNGAYNDFHHAAMEEAAKVTDIADDPDPLLMQCSEYFDRRTCPISRAADGTVAALSEPFRIPVAAVEAESAGPKRRSSGACIPKVGAYYVGRYPLNFNERGRTIPYRASWDDGVALSRMSGAQLTGIPKATIAGKWREMAA